MRLTIFLTTCACGVIHIIKFRFFFLRYREELTHARFFKSNTFISNARLKLAKNQANAEQHPEAELLLLENYSYSSSTLSCKSNRTYSKNKQKSKCVCIHHIIQLIIMKMKNRPPRYDINRPKPRYSAHKKSLKMLLICIKQHNSNI